MMMELIFINVVVRNHAQRYEIPKPEVCSDTDFRTVSLNTAPQTETEHLNIALTAVLLHDVMHNPLYFHLRRLFYHQY